MYKGIKTLLKRILFLALAYTAASAAMQGPSPAWHPSVITVTQTVPGHEGRLYTKLELAKNGDARVTYEQKGGSKPRSGTILVISGRWMLVKGLQLEKGHEIDLLDKEGLNSQLVLTLLSKGLPNGSPASGQFRKISATEKKEPIRIATGSGKGIFLPPWSVTGSVTSVSESIVNYSLDLKVERDRNLTVHLEGTVSNPDKTLELSDTMSLSGWAVYKIGPYEEQTSNGTVLNYGAKATKVTARTLGELRAGD